MPIRPRVLCGFHARILLDANDQLFRAEDYGRLIIAYKNNAPVHLSDVATVVNGQVNVLNTGLINGRPMVELDLSASPRPISLTRSIA